LRQREVRPQRRQFGSWW